MGWTVGCVVEPGRLDSLEDERLWELWRLLGIRGFAAVSDTTWSAGADDDLEVSLVRRRELPVGVDRPRFDELRLRTTSSVHGAAWRLLNRDVPAVAALAGARLAWVMSDDEQRDQRELLTVHRSLRSGELAPFDPTLLAVPTGSVLEVRLAARGPVGHDTGYAVRRRPVP